MYCCVRRKQRYNTKLMAASKQPRSGHNGKITNMDMYSGVCAWLMLLIYSVMISPDN